jgi:hypothetical protein
MYSQMQLMIFAIFAGLGQEASNPKEQASDNAMAVFSFFLFVLYAVFSVFLFLFRHYVIDGKRECPQFNVPAIQCVPKNWH